ncbi:MAG: hypothetical protein OJF55_000532 [Rhodanobacteraceae bacterium]|nr:MAG: hypothetical protein OJF55_000532 [Rhodanobacteraceae bacterium]
MLRMPLAQRRQDTRSRPHARLRRSNPVRIDCHSIVIPA